MENFNVGDKIRAKKIADKFYSFTNLEHHWEGVVLRKINLQTISVRTTRCEKDGESLIGATFTVNPMHFEKIKDKREKDKYIYITTDGKTVTAVIKENGAVKKATAKCSPEDTFDLYTGAILALKRLFGKEKIEIRGEKPFTGYMKAGKVPKGFTEGKIYQFTEGRCIDDEGRRRPDKGIWNVETSPYSEERLLRFGFKHVTMEDIREIADSCRREVREREKREENYGKT